MVDLVVLMSVYRNDKLNFVKEAVESILNQSYKCFHFFLIFDGPVSYEIEKYIEGIKDERIRLFRLDMNRGLATAMNTLLEIVLKNPEYKYIARMDADDVSMLNRFEKQRSFLIQHPEMTVLGSWYEEINEDGRHIRFRKLPVYHESLIKRYYTRTPIAHSSVMYHRLLIEKAGLYPNDTCLMEDNVLWGRGFIKGLKFGNIPEYLLKFRIDKYFFERRSGFKYCFSFIKTRFKILKEFPFSFRASVVVVLRGIIMLLPPFLLRFSYLLVNSFSKFPITIKSNPSSIN